MPAPTPQGFELVKKIHLSAELWSVENNLLTPTFKMKRVELKKYYQKQIDALYATAATPGALPAEIETQAMARLRTESHARMLGNGMCTRPVELDCRMETICETCAYFDTGPEFVPVLLRQRDHARTHRQNDRVELYDGLITRAEESSP